MLTTPGARRALLSLWLCLPLLVDVFVGCQSSQLENLEKKRTIDVCPRNDLRLHKVKRLGIGCGDEPRFYAPQRGTQGQIIGDWVWLEVPQGATKTHITIFDWTTLRDVCIAVQLQTRASHGEPRGFLMWITD